MVVKDRFHCITNLCDATFSLIVQFISIRARWLHVSWWCLQPIRLSATVTTSSRTAWVHFHATPDNINQALNFYVTVYLIKHQPRLTEITPLPLSHWGRVTHICVSELTIIGSDNGLSPGRRRAIIWNNAGILLIEPLGTNFSEISIGIQTFSFKKMHLNMSSAKWRPFCLGFNLLYNPFCWISGSHLPICPNITWLHGSCAIAWQCQ